MWELDCEECWASKNWCFWNVVLEKTLESPLDCKEIQPVHSEGDQSWVFIGRTDAEAETPILWQPHAKSWLIGKDQCWEGLGAGGEGDDRGWDGWMASPTRWTWVWASSGSWWWTGKPGVLQSMGCGVRHDWGTELTELSYLPCVVVLICFPCVQLCEPVDCSPPGSSVHGILHGRILEWVAMPSSKESSPPKDPIWVSYISCIADRFFTAESLGKSSYLPWVWTRKLSINCSIATYNYILNQVFSICAIMPLSFSEERKWLCATYHQTKNTE